MLEERVVAPMVIVVGSILASRCCKLFDWPCEPLVSDRESFRDGQRMNDLVEPRWVEYGAVDGAVVLDRSHVHQEADLQELLHRGTDDAMPLVLLDSGWIESGVVAVQAQRSHERRPRLVLERHLQIGRSRQHPLQCVV
ncbi:hypothetical protein [Candidatus Poriferisodalis sp.]|uniref:hypothetical protein n=1 Tax=Candidatus Poriferisodalis sp. TaxID=3101277 RepID=UPI003D0FEFE1